MINEFAKISTMNFGREIPIFFLNFLIYVLSFYYNFKEFHSPDNEWNSSLIQIIQKSQLEFIELKDAFMVDYALNFQKCDFRNDYYYNEHGHELVGKYLSGYILDSI